MNVKNGKWWGSTEPLKAPFGTVPVDYRIVRVYAHEQPGCVRVEPYLTAKGPALRVTVGDFARQFGCVPEPGMQFRFQDGAWEQEPCERVAPLHIAGNAGCAYNF